MMHHNIHLRLARIQGQHKDVMHCGTREDTKTIFIITVKLKVLSNFVRKGIMISGSVQYIFRGRKRHPSLSKTETIIPLLPCHQSQEENLIARLAIYGTLDYDEGVNCRMVRESINPCMMVAKVREKPKCLIDAHENDTQVL